MDIALFTGGYILLAIYILISIILYNKLESTKYDLRNHFAYELWFSHKRNGYIFLLPVIIIFLLSVPFSFIHFTINNFNVMNVVTSVSVLIASFSFGVLFIVDLSHLKLRCYFSIIAFVSTLLAASLNIYQEVVLLMPNENYILILPIIINGLIAVFSVFSVFSPRLFDFRYDRDEEGYLERKKIIPLAFYEWILVIMFPLLEISLIVFNLI